MPLKYMIAKKDLLCDRCEKPIITGNPYWERYKIGKSKTREHTECRMLAQLPLLSKKVK